MPCTHIIHSYSGQCILPHFENSTVFFRNTQYPKLIQSTHYLHRLPRKKLALLNRRRYTGDTVAHNYFGSYCSASSYATSRIEGTISRELMIFLYEQVNTFLWKVTLYKARLMCFNMSNMWNLAYLNDKWIDAYKWNYSILCVWHVFFHKYILIVIFSIICLT